MTDTLPMTPMALDPATWTEPTEHLVADDPRYGSVTVTAWADLHPRLSGRGHWTSHDVLLIVEGTVIRIGVEHLPRPSARTKKTLWLWWSRTPGSRSVLVECGSDERCAHAAACTGGEPHSLVRHRRNP